MDKQGAPAQSDAYANYLRWKDWGASDPSVFAEQFATEASRAGLRAGARILEVGFGNGEFLDWARDAGYTVSGLEKITELADVAEARGHRVHRCSVEDLPQVSAVWDAIVLFDVLEHLEKREIIRWMEIFHGLLAPGGKIVARFPNGASPFGRTFQYGDLTHVTVLSPSALDQAALGIGYAKVEAFNAARSYHGGRTRSGAIPKRIAYAVRDLVEWLYGLVYLGRRVPLDPNVTVIITR